MFSFLLFNWIETMARSKKVVEQTNQAEAVEAKPVEQVNEAPVALTKDDYIKARATIKSYREAQKAKPKRKCSEAQLAALKAGREKNKRFQKKTSETTK